MTIFNPAYTGTQEAPMLSMSYRSQWSGIDGAPVVQAFSFGTPTSNERVGIGLSIINDEIFIQRQTHAYVNFSYKLPMSEETDLFLGLQAGANGTRLEAEALESRNTTSGIDPNLLNYSQFVPNVGVGVYLKNNKYFVSLSAPRILNSKRYLDQQGLYTSATDRVHFYASGGVNLFVSDRWTLSPFLLYRQVAGAPTFLSLNTTFNYDQFIDFGIEYNLESGFGANLMLKTQGGLSFGYAYETPRESNISQLTNGTHELILKIRLGNSSDSSDRRIGTRNKEKRVAIK